MLLDDAVHRGKSQTRTLADVLGGVKWVEYSRKILGFDTVPGIAHTQTHETAGASTSVASSLPRIYGLHGRSNLQLSAVGHGIPGIQTQVE